VIEHPLGEFAARIVWRVLLQEPATQAAATRQGEAGREHEVIAE